MSADEEKTVDHYFKHDLIINQNKFMRTTTDSFLYSNKVIPLINIEFLYTHKLNVHSSWQFYQ
jgi:hypothetical protein